MLIVSEIDWQEVANGNGITNGHAARMRYSRFKAQMEGLPATTRKPRVAVPRQRKSKSDKSANVDKNPTPATEPIIRGESRLKMENENQIGPMEGIEPTVKLEPAKVDEPSIKPEPENEGNAHQGLAVTVNVEVMRGIHPQLVRAQDAGDVYSSIEAASDISGEPRVPKEEPVVKSEHIWEEL